MMTIVQAVMQGAQAGFGEMIFDASDNTKGFEVTAEPPVVNIGDPPTQHGLYLQKVHPELHLRHVERIVVKGTAKLIRIRFPLRRGQLQGTVYSWGEAIVEGKSAVVVTTKDAEGITTVCMRGLGGSPANFKLPPGEHGESGTQNQS